MEAVIVHVSPTAVSHHYYDLGPILNVVFLSFLDILLGGLRELIYK